MILFESLLVALSTYSAIPVPQFEWNERNMKYAICFFPAVGILCGAALWGWSVLADFLGVSGFFFAAIATCLPLLITGGIHMDGYIDTVDALASHQSRERKLEILKDPSCGAFAVICCGVYLLAYAALVHELFAADCILVVCPAFVMTRALSALCAVNLPNARKAGMLHAYTKDTEKRTATIALIAVFAAGGAGSVLLSPIVGCATVLFAIASVLIYRRTAMKQFGGVTGDTSGFFLQISELACLIGAWTGAHVLKVVCIGAVI